jgi:opacity protein-like surface antigen
MIIRSLGLALILIAMAAPPVAAESGPDYARTGPYLGAGLALGWEDYEAFGVSLSGFDTGVGFDVWGGYRFHPNFAAELELGYVDRVNLGPLDTSLLTFTGNLKGYLTRGRVQPFALVGIGVTRVGFGPVSESAFGARFGGGIDYYLSENVSLGATASYVLATGDLDPFLGVVSFDYVSLVMGAQYRF